MENLADQFYILCSAATDMPEVDLRLMLKINKHHFLPIKHMTLDELNTAKSLAATKWIELVPENHRISQDVERNRYGDATLFYPRKHNLSSKPIPERYVMLSSGNHALGTFDFDTLSDEKREYYKSKYQR